MSQSLVLSDELYARLQAAARQRGVEGIEQLLELWHSDELELSRRQEAVRNIQSLRTRLSTLYGEMPDSTELIREDRAR